MNDSTLPDDVAEYYARGGELTRLTGNAGGRLEFLRTRDILRRVLPKPPAAVLDVGGATGVHARWLVADGYDVTLIDPVASHVAHAAGIDGVDAHVGDARALEFETDSHDAVLLLGPMYHLQTGAERLRALAEARRVARPKGFVAAATIGRFAPWLDAMLHRMLVGARFEEQFATGQLYARDIPQAFTTAYTHRPEQIAAEFDAAGLPGATAYAVEGPAWLVASVGEQLDVPEETDELMKGLRALETEPSLLGASPHLLTIAEVA